MTASRAAARGGSGSVPRNRWEERILATGVAHALTVQAGDRSHPSQDHAGFGLPAGKLHLIPCNRLCQLPGRPAAGVVGLVGGSS